MSSETTRKSKLNQIGVFIKEVSVEKSDLLRLIQYIEQQKLSAASSGDAVEFSINLEKLDGLVLTLQSSEEFSNSGELSRRVVQRLLVSFNNKTKDESISARLIFSSPKSISDDMLRDRCVSIASDDKEFRQKHRDAIKQITGSFTKRSFWLRNYESLALLIIIILGGKVLNLILPGFSNGVDFYSILGLTAVVAAASLYFSWRRNEMYKVFPAIMLHNRGEYELSLNEISHLCKIVIFDLGILLITIFIYDVLL